MVEVLLLFVNCRALLVLFFMYYKADKLVFPQEMRDTLNLHPLRRDPFALCLFFLRTALVWYIFREIYATDGSPEVCRWTTDIYTPDVTATRKMRLETETHTKAVYELRRFVARIKEECGKKMMAENASKGNDNKRRAHVFPPVPE